VPHAEGADREGARGAGREALHAPFRPRRGPLVARVVGVVALVGGIALAVAIPGRFVWWDRASFVAVGLAIALFMHRQATVRALPSERGLRVRNLAGEREVAWSEVADVRFGGGRPWVQLELADGDTLAVMGVQRADGPEAEAQARRLATLVALHQRGRTAG